MKYYVTYTLQRQRLCSMHETKIKCAVMAY